MYEIYKKKINFKYYIAICINLCLFILFTPNSNNAYASSSLPDTTNGIHLALPGSNHLSTSQLITLNNKIDIIWNENSGKTNLIPNGVIKLGYIPFELDNYYLTGKTLTWWLANHPSWVMYNCDRKTPSRLSGSTDAMLDITNPAVRSYQMSVIQTYFSNLNGVSWDNVTVRNEGGACGIWNNGAWKQIYSGNITDNTFQNSVIQWASAMYTAVKQYRTNFVVAMNYQMPDPFNLIAPYLDLDFEERGFTNWGVNNSNYLTDTLWDAEYQDINYLNTQGKGVILNAEEPAPYGGDASISETEINWALANYLLVKGSHTYTYIEPQQEYGGFYDRPEYHISIGTDQNQAYIQQHVYMRDYTGGKILVNPSGSSTYTVSLPHTYVTLTGAETNTNLSLQPHTGIVLLNPLRTTTTPTITPTTNSITPTQTQAISTTTSPTPPPPGNVQIVNNGNTPISKAQILFSNGVTTTTGNNGEASLPNSNSNQSTLSINKITIAGKQLTTNIPINTNQGYIIKTNPNAGQVIAVYAFSQLNYPWWWLILAGVGLIIALTGVTIFLQKRSLNTKNSAYMD